MQRSMFLPNGAAYKNNIRIMFDEVLDLSSITTHPVHKVPINTKGTTIIRQRDPLYFGRLTSCWNHADNTVKEEVEEQKIVEPLLYELKSVVLHYGSHESGHFVALRRIDVPDEEDEGKKIRKRWYRISDDKVTLVNHFHEEVLEHGSYYVYMLFYERVHIKERMNQVQKM
jgi:ubiquitin carboxyl-terminal hydrolase 1